MTEESPIDRPNVVFLYADDLGYGDLGCYGCPDIDTPNIDSIADSGVRFTDAYAASPVCSPSRVAFVTGRYPQRAGPHCEGYIGGGNPGLDPETNPSIARHLGNRGYDTASIGKWNVGGDPEHEPDAYGFDHWLGFHHNFNYYTHSQYWYQDGELRDGPPMLYANGDLVDREGYITDVLADEAIDFVEAHADGPEPFFAYVPFQAPHAPMQSPHSNPEEPPEYGVPDFDQDREVYTEIVEHLDHHVGRILDTLEERGIAEDTLVVFSSDNGGHRAARNCPLAGFKQDLYEGGIRVPLLVSWPGTIPDGRVSEQPAITMDITATIASQAGVGEPSALDMDGIDLVPYCTGERAPDRDRTLYWRRRTLLGHDSDEVRVRAIRDNQWKYLRDRDPVGPPGYTEGTFDLAADMEESNNLLESEVDITEELTRQLASWERTFDNRDFPSE